MKRILWTVLLCLLVLFVVELAKAQCHVRRERIRRDANQPMIHNDPQFWQ